MNVISEIKEIINLVQAIGNRDLHRKIVDLETEIIEIMRENRTLKESLNVSKNLSYRKPFYYLQDDPVPYCPCCWEEKRLPIHLKEVYCHPDSSYRYDCPSCKEMYTYSRPYSESDWIR